MPHFIAFSFCVFAAIAPAVAVAWPVAGEPVLVVAAPGAGRDGALIAVLGSGGRVLSLRSNGLVAVAVSDASDFTGRLYAAGAILVLRGRAGPCGGFRIAQS